MTCRCLTLDSLVALHSLEKVHTDPPVRKQMDFHHWRATNLIANVTTALHNLPWNVNSLISLTCKLSIYLYDLFFYKPLTVFWNIANLSPTCLCFKVSITYSYTRSQGSPVNGNTLILPSSTGILLVHFITLMIFGSYCCNPTLVWLNHF